MAKSKNAEIVKMPKEDGEVMPVAEAKRLRDAIIADLRSAEGSLVSAAIRLAKFTKRQGWKALGYETMTEWREAEVRFAEFFRLRNVSKLLEQGVPAESVEKMKFSNIDMLARQLPPSEWKKPEWQKAAAEIPVAEFERRAKARAEDVGTVQEEIERRGFAGPRSLVEQYDLALKVAEAVDGAVRMEERIEIIVATYLNSDSRGGKTRLQLYQDIAVNK